MDRKRLRIITVVGIMTAFSNILYFLQIPIPIFPSFLTFDPSDIPALIVGIIYGPIIGITVEFLKNVIAYILHGSYVGLPMGQIANFLSGALIVGLASLLYRKNNNPHLVLFIPVILVFLFAMYLLNLYFILPIIVKLLGMNMNDYVNWVKVTNPYVNNLETIVLFVVTPFNLLKILLVYLAGIPLALRLQKLLKPSVYSPTKINHSISSKH